MKIAIIGAGAIGGYVGVKLALAGEDVTFMVRGANLTAIQNNGMKLMSQTLATMNAAMAETDRHASRAKAVLMMCYQWSRYHFFRRPGMARIIVNIVSSRNTRPYIPHFAVGYGIILLFL